MDQEPLQRDVRAGFHGTPKIPPSLTLQQKQQLTQPRQCPVFEIMTKGLFI